MCLLFYLTWDFEQKFVWPVVWLQSSAIETGSWRHHSQAGYLFSRRLPWFWCAAVFRQWGLEVVTQTCYSWSCTHKVRESANTVTARQEIPGWTEMTSIPPATWDHYKIETSHLEAAWNSACAGDAVVRKLPDTKAEDHRSLSSL